MLIIAALTRQDFNHICLTLTDTLLSAILDRGGTESPAVTHQAVLIYSFNHFKANFSSGNF